MNLAVFQPFISAVFSFIRPFSSLLTRPFCNVEHETVSLLTNCIHPDECVRELRTSLAAIDVVSGKVIEEW